MQECFRLKVACRPDHPDSLSAGSAADIDPTRGSAEPKNAGAAEIRLPQLRSGHGAQGGATKPT
jgi:hypothetical protein